MNLSFAMKPESVAILSATDKNDVLAKLSALFAQAWTLDAAEVLRQLQAREELGSTGFGRGVAIPHARFSGISRPVAALIRLNQPIDFDAADKMPVELVFGLLSPADSGAAHLHVLAAISRLVREERFHEAIIDAPDAEAIYGLLTNVTDRDAA